jgi:hypothetical protein
MVNFMNEYPANYPRHGFHVCHGCASMVPHHTQENAPDNGWTFDINNFGYYAGFTDPIGDDSQHVRLCHDCVLKLLETFPLLGLLVQPGSHSQNGPNEKPCCKYAWKTESIADSSITYMASDDANSWEIAYAN